MLNRSPSPGVVPLNFLGEYLEKSESRQPHAPFPAGASRLWQKPTHRHFIFDTGYHTRCTVTRGGMTWHGMGVELVQAITHECVAHSFRSPPYLFAAYQQRCPRSKDRV